MQFIDLKAQQARIYNQLTMRFQTVLNHGNYIMGPEIKELEKKLGGFVGVKHAVGCASGTDALLMALMAYGIGTGDAVLTTPFTFVATAEVISLLGATPVFVDIDPETFNVDPALLESAITALEQGKNRSILFPRGTKNSSPRESLPWTFSASRPTTIGSMSWPDKRDSSS